MWIFREHTAYNISVMILFKNKFVNKLPYGHNLFMISETPYGTINCPALYFTMYHLQNYNHCTHPLQPAPFQPVWEGTFLVCRGGGSFA